MKRYASAIGLLLLFLACESGPEVEEGVFFPTWSADADRPLAVVQGVLVEANGCVYISANGQRTLPLWEEGLGLARHDRRDGNVVGSGTEHAVEEVSNGESRQFGATVASPRCPLTADAAQPVLNYGRRSQHPACRRC